MNAGEISYTESLPTMNATQQRLTAEVQKFDAELRGMIEMEATTDADVAARTDEIERLTGEIAKRQKSLEIEKAGVEARAKVEAARQSHTTDAGLVVTRAKAPAEPKRVLPYVQGQVRGFETIEAADAAGRALVRLARGELRELRAVTVAASTHPIGVNNTLEPDSMGEASPLYDGRGSELVAHEMYRGIINVINYESIAAQLATWLQVNTDGMYVPMGDDIQDADWYEENCEILPIKPSTKRATLALKKMGARVQVSNELMEDAYVSVAQVVTNTIGNAFAHKLDKTLLQGDTKIGFGGLVPAIPAGQTTTAAAAGKPTVDELASLIAKVDPMATNRMWLVSEAGWSKVMGLATGAIGVNVTSAITQSIFGAPVMRTSLLPNKVLAVYGDFKKAAVIGYKSGLTIRSSSERAIEYDQTVFVGTARYAFAVAAAKYLAVLKDA